MLNKQDLEQEKKYLEEIIELVKEKIAEAKIDTTKTEEELFEFRNYLWNDCRALFTSEDIERKIEFEFLLNTQNEKEQKHIRNINKKNKLLKSLNSPYFGKIVFNNKDLYIGAYNIEKDYDIKVYDWRAPISSMFYDYQLGKAKYKINEEKYEEGTITQKRQFVIENSQMKSAIENEQNIEDTLLQEILSKESTEKMSNIINTIQKEQNQVIRNLTDKVVVTEGVAGSGKTEIALHRIAYLLYHEEEYNSNNILIFSPNNIFTKYISNVLPELSEDNVLSTTFSYFAQRYIYIDMESYTNFLDRIYENNYDLDEFNDNYKEKLELFLNKYKNSIEFTTGLKFKDYHLTKEDMNNYFIKYNKLSILEIINKIVDNVMHANNFKTKYYETIREKLISILNKTINPLDVFNEFLKENNKEEIKDFIYYENITGLLYTIFYIKDYPDVNNIKHIVIDEAQDYSLFQLELLKNIFIGASFTILGDSNQNLNPYITYSSLKEYLNLFKEGIYYKLKKAYRSSKNIMKYASQILNLEVDCFRHDGNKVEFRDINNTKTIYEDIDKLKEKRLAIITKDKKDCEYLYNLLFDRYNICSPLFDTKSTKIVIIPVYIAKGLEFDGVIIYDSKKYDKELLYVAATRAQNNLIVYE